MGLAVSHVASKPLTALVNLIGNMTEANTVYSNVKFIKKEGKKETTETTSTPDETTYSEIKVTKAKSPAESVGPPQAHGGSKVTWLTVLLVLMAALLTAAAIGLAFTSYSYFQTMEKMLQLAADYRNLTETCSREPEPTERPDTCPVFQNTTKPCLNCPDGWVAEGSRCYYFSDDSLGWEAAREKCQQQGADLVQVSSKEEQTFLSVRVKDLMRNNEDRFWIGLTDAVEEDQWLWVDGSPLDERLKFWISSEPDNWKGEDPARGEDCGSLGDKRKDEYCWYDRACFYQMRSICEKSGKAGHLVCAES